MFQCDPTLDLFPGGIVKGPGKAAGKALASRAARRALQKQVDDVARRFGLDRQAFGDFVEARKEGVGRGGADNLTFRELEELAKEFSELIKGK